MSVTINVRSRKLVRGLSYFTVGFLLAGIFSYILKYDFGLTPGLFRWFDVDGEKNFPSAFSSGILLFCAVLLLIIAVAKRANKDPFTRHWAGLGCIFILLGADEWLSFHEKLGILMETRMPTSNAFHYAWIIVGIAFVAFVGIAYGRFLLRLPKPCRRLFLTAAGIYISGTIGMEMVGGYYVDNHQQWNPAIWLTLTTIEEGLEMIGTVTFIYALITYIQSSIGELNVRISPVSTALLTTIEPLAEQPINARTNQPNSSRL